MNVSARLTRLVSEATLLDTCYQCLLTTVHSSTSSLHACSLLRLSAISRFDQLPSQPVGASSTVHQASAVVQVVFVDVLDRAEVAALMGWGWVPPSGVFVDSILVRKFEPCS